MPTTTIDTLRTKLANKLPSCPAPVILDQIRDTIDEFCRESGIWTYEMDKVFVNTSEDEYDLEYPSYARPTHIKEVWLDGCLLEANRDYLMKDVDTILLSDAPGKATTASDDGLEITLILTIKPDALLIDQDLYRDWAKAWEFGTLAYLQMTSGKWANPRAAEFNMQKYREMVDRAKWRAVAGGTTGDVKMQVGEFDVPGSQQRGWINEDYFD